MIRRHTILFKLLALVLAALAAAGVIRLALNYRDTRQKAAETAALAEAGSLPNPRDILI